jgi:glycosyltransferase involved in cell wall biosynthesis
MRPLTIAQMLESGGPGGAETVLLQLSDELRARGHTIVPVRMPDGETWLNGQLAERGLPHEEFHLDRPVDLPAVKRLDAILRARRVDAVHSHEFTMAVYGAAAARRLGVPHVITMHGNQTMADKLRRRVALRWAYRRSRAVVAVSQATRKDLLERLGPGAGEITVIPNGVPARPGEASGPRAEFGIQPDEVVILAVGNLSKRKGHIILLQAMARLQRAGLKAPWRVIIAGRGDEHDALQAFAREEGMADRVHLAGHRDDIPDLQEAAHILCMPSLWEGLPLAVLEGMHAGNCIVATRTSGIPEAIDSEENGLLVEPGNPEDLADALKRVLEDMDLRGRLSAAALDTARSRFSIAGMADRYEALYH